MHDDAIASSSSNLKLEDTVARYEAIFASTLDPIVIIDSRGIIHSASDSIERVFGWTPSEVIGRNVSILMPEPHRSMHDTYLDRYRQTGKTNILGQTREFEVVKKDGTRFPIELSVSRVDVPGEREPLFTGIIHDLSERKRAEDERALIQRLAIGISSASDLDAALAIALKEICDKTGWDYGEAWLPDSNGEVLTDGPYWHHSGNKLTAFRKATQGRQLRVGEGLPGRVLRSRQPEWLTDLDSTDRGTFLRGEAARQAGLKAGFAIPILSGDAVVAVIAFYAQQRRKADNSLLELVSAATAPLGQVIRRRRAEDALIESERRFREMLNNVSLVAIMLDLDGRVTFCDDFLLKTAGYEHRHEIIGCNWFDRFIPAEERDEVFKLFQSGLKQGKIAPHFENHILTRTGEKRRIAWSNSLMHGPDGSVIGATALGVDVTEQRRLDEELERHRSQLEQLVAERTADLQATHEQLRMADRLASIGTLTAGLGHDMNNMLLPMRCRLDAVKQMDLPDALRGHFIQIRDSVDYLQQLTDGLQLFALDPEDAEASTATTDIGAWWSQVGPLLSRVVPQSATFSAVLSEDLPPAAVPSHRLTQAVLNLIVNAGEAIDGNGRVQFRVSTVDDGRFVRLRVIDNGCGMSDELKQRVLDPFFTTKKRGLGTGLGLSLVRGVAQAAGGSIKIDSEPGRGTVMTLLLPAAATAGAGEDQGDAAASPSITASVTIADPRAATFIVVLLQGAGIAVESATNQPPSSDLWFADASIAGSSEAGRYLEQPRRWLILYGRPDEDRPQPGPHHRMPHDRLIIIDEPDNFESIRRLINDVVGSVAEIHDSSETVTS